MTDDMIRRHEFALMQMAHDMRAVRDGPDGAIEQAEERAWVQ